MKTSGNTILITGGGTGIGEALAHRFHDLGNTVIVAGRRRELLEQSIAGRANMHAMTLDIGNAQAIGDFAARVVADFPAVNVLINNAGIIMVENIARPRDLGDAEAIVTTNLLGTIRLTNALIGHLAARNDATVVNVTSALAYVPSIIAPTYCATKAALHSYTMSLRESLRGKVEVIELVPPAVRTAMAGGSESDEFQPLDEFADQVVALFAQQPTPPEIVVERAKYLRMAEVENRFDETLQLVTQAGREALDNDFDPSGR